MTNINQGQVNQWVMHRDMCCTADVGTCETASLKVAVAGIRGEVPHSRWNYQLVTAGAGIAHLAQCCLCALCWLRMLAVGHTQVVWSRVWSVGAFLSKESGSCTSS
jgi:hypothetical protein